MTYELKNKENANVGLALRNIRKSKGLTAQDVAKALGFSTHKTIIDIETGKRDLKDEELNKFTQIYKIRKEELLDKKEEDSFSTFFRANQEELSDQTKKELEKIKEEIEQYKKFQSLLEIKSTTLIPTSFWCKNALPIPTNNHDAILQGDLLANDLRQSLELGDDPIDDINYVVQRLGIQLFNIELDDRISGFIINYQTSSPLIFVNSKQKPQRRIFSIAHEICHFLVDCDPNLKWSNITQIVDPTSERYQKDFREVRANRFAAAFLMPKASLEKYITQVLGKNEKTIDKFDIVRLQYCYKVSFKSALYRLWSLNLMTNNVYENIKEALSEGEFKIEELSKALGFSENDYPIINQSFYTNLRSLAIQCYLNSKISIGKLCEVLTHPIIKQNELLKYLGIEKIKYKKKLKNNPLLVS